MTLLNLERALAAVWCHRAGEGWRWVGREQTPWAQLQCWDQAGEAAAWVDEVQVLGTDSALEPWLLHFVPYRSCELLNAWTSVSSADRAGSGDLSLDDLLSVLPTTLMHSAPSEPGTSRPTAAFTRNCQEDGGASCMTYHWTSALTSKKWTW